MNQIFKKTALKAFQKIEGHIDLGKNFKINKNFNLFLDFEKIWKLTNDSIKFCKKNDENTHNEKVEFYFISLQESIIL